jgi:myo-inositol-1-phosphate synthase
MINVGIIGLGNCASSLIQGIEYYANRTDITGLMKPIIGGYEAKDINISVAFDIDKRKINLPIKDAIFQKPNCTYVFNPNIKNANIVYTSPVLDGYALVMDSYPEDDRFLVSEELRNTTDYNRIKNVNATILSEFKRNIIALLKEKNVEILINYLPVGSQKATEFWAEICLETNISFLNCIPVFIASDPIWERKFFNANIPIVGDDMKSEFGASILSQMLQELAFARGHKVKCHIQRNVGGNTDFLNMEDKTRLQSKKISKENVIRSQNTIYNIPLEDSFLHAGPSEYIKYYKDNKIANFRLELEGFGNAPVILDAQLSVQDSPNSAGVVIDAIRYLKIARELGLKGALKGASAFTQKTPPIQMTFEDAKRECDMLANREISKINTYE